MAFISLEFLVFIGFLFLTYFLVPKKYQWIVLLLFSYIFFIISSGKLVLYHIVTTLITYYSAIIIYNIKYKKSTDDNDGTFDEKKNKKVEIKKKQKRILSFSVFLILFILVFLKYYNFISGNINKLLKPTSYSLPSLKLMLPLGISFYTLQAIAYLVDVYRNKIEPDTNPFKFMLFMSYFPQIVQGPIARYNQLAHQLYEKHQFDMNRFSFGIQLILWGFIKKIIIADRINIPVKQVFDKSNGYTGMIIFLVAALYGIQVYADFSGGMDIARGVSQVLGIELELNFNQPYFSTSIEEFWRRWHITLGSWMKDYVFYPLSLSKKAMQISRKTRPILGLSFSKKFPSFIAMFIVYFLVGIWHGASWKYIAYGLYNGFFILFGITFEEIYGKIRDWFEIDKNSLSWKAFQTVRTFVLISIGRYFSRGNGTKAALKLLYKTFQNCRDLSFITNGTLLKLGLNTANWILLMLSVVGLFIVDFLHEKSVNIREMISKQPFVFKWLIYTAAVLSILIFGIYGPSYDAASFIYEQF